ncbi:bifunctional ADP-dependent NAD(P)H-hydrate dehydratase/NAD(P)H-hydrate epimerase [Pseudothermotoga thermarum]|uniref:Bifunctional NAD(P)H-hydrate repair enzyme n=1 Tax=Pseudothermotoga thermarum DSM 5069 TaxID=688269 RepID=F7YTD5_9THEM|nr:bifunctional ADP-dependent NAD(P)H-hydrate dehydratase/NAD(P)H-hydrate epimerase [Pseudothermotoga thermarum]AEH50113.1 carbohydrate kinase, YjeF related protein [Pseudothermotoga thermarum DSM 5069]
MKVLTAHQMKEIDRLTSERFLISPEILMERAGLSVVLALQSELKDLSKKSFLVLCGHGNNGGDGLVVARILHQYTDEVVTVVVGDKTKMSSETLANFKRLKAIGGIIKFLNEDLSLDELVQMVKNYDVVIDALLGIGIKGSVQGILAQVIDVVNLYARYVVSVDLPSGLDTDTGKVLGKAIKADLTVTFGLPKLCHILFPGRELTGILKVADIGIPKILLNADEIKRNIVTKDLVLSSLPKRIKDSHKGSYGKVLVIAGSKNYPGAAVLTSIAAYRVGSGYVQLVTCKPADEIALVREPSLIVRGFEQEFFTPSCLPTVFEVAKNSKVVVLGPGLTQSDQTREFVLQLLKELDLPMIIDADGLNNIAENLDVLFQRKGPTLLTPHFGEFARLVKLPIEAVKYNYSLVEEFSKKYGVITLLKGATTIISNGESTYFNLMGNTSLAKAGSGDVLAGMIGGLAAQGLDLLSAAFCGAYLHGLAAEMYNLKEGTMLTSELLDLIPKAMEEVCKVG